jgi:NTE family protein
MMHFGLALGSGGARGLAHVGVLDVLDEEGLRPHCISGTSMGSIVGALYAKYLDADLVDEHLRSYWENPDFKECWAPFVEDDEFTEDNSFFKEFRRSIERKVLTFKTFTSPAQRGADKLMEPLAELLGDTRIEDLELPFATIAIDLISGDPKVFTEGPLTEAIYASSAIPGVFPPIAMEGKMLTDGGGSYRVPITDCRRLGADFVLAVDIPTFEKDLAGFDRGLDIVMRSDAIARNRLNKMVLQLADFVITPEVGQFHWANMSAAPQIRQQGVLAAREAMPELRKAIRRHRGLGQRFRRAILGKTA